LGVKLSLRVTVFQAGKCSFQLPALISSWLSSLSTPARTSTSHKTHPQTKFHGVGGKNVAGSGFFGLNINGKN